MVAPHSRPSSQGNLLLSSSQEEASMTPNSIRYTQAAVAPLPKVANSLRFKSFVDRINKRQWEFLSDSVQAQVRYNKHDLTLYELTQLLKQEFAPKTTTTMDIVTTVGGDHGIDGPVAARLRVKRLVTEGPYLPHTPRHHLEYARHMFVFFTDTKISQIYDISEDSESQTQRNQSQSQTPIPLPPTLRPPPPRTSIDLRQFYTDYIACINTNTGHLATDLAPFCKPSGVNHNGTHYSVSQYAAMIQSSLDTISGLFFDVHTLLVDEERQMLAARIEFTGTPVKAFAGVVPERDGGGSGHGRKVEFAEHVFYWLEGGRIGEVLSLVDWDGFRAQVANSK